MITDKRLAQHRINTYLNEKETSINLQKDGLQCDFGTLNNTDSIFTFLNIEAILYCDQRTYTYKSSQS